MSSTTIELWIQLWFWEIRDPSTGRWRKTSWRMTEEDARQRHGTDARRLEWSREVRSGELNANSTSSFQRNPWPIGDQVP